MDSNQSANPQPENPASETNGPSEIQLQLPSEVQLPVPPPVQPEIPPQATAPEKKVWGGWSTVGFSAVILVVFFMAQTILAFAFVFLNPGLITNTTAMMDLTTNGLLLSLATYISASAGLTLVIVFIKIRKGYSITEYLGLQKPRVRTILVVLGITLVLMLVSDIIGTYLAGGGSSNDQFTVNAYITVWPPLLWIAVVIFAPVFEESFFRGFLFVGLKNSRLGAAGAIIITALLFGVLHYSQYDIYGVMTIFIFGIALGFIRLLTKSLWSTIAVHAFWNFLTMVLTALVVNGVIK